MKNSLLIIFLLAFGLSGYSQVFLLQEFFKDTVNLPATWTTIDKDGDSHNWRINKSGTNAYAVSDSWMSGVIGALTPENYLVSPRIDLTELTGIVKLRYTIQIADPVSVYEHYKVAVSVSGNKATDFKAIVNEETCTTADYYGNPPGWKEKIVDLTPYIGQHIYLTWCHFYCTNMYQLLLDSIQVSNTPEVNLAFQEHSLVTVYPNPAKEKLNITGTFENAQVQLFATNGWQVYQSGNETKQAIIPVSHFENGLYILKINSPKGVVTKKVSISH